MSTKQAYINQIGLTFSILQKPGKNPRPVPGRGVVDTARVEAVLVPRVVGRGDKVLTVKNTYNKPPKKNCCRLPSLKLTYIHF